MQTITTLTIDQLIIHQIPKVPTEGREHAAPRLSQVPVVLDNSIRTYIRERIVNSLNSESFPVVYIPPAADEDADGEADETIGINHSPVPGLIVQFFLSEGENFVEASRVAANHLYLQQRGTASAGMLAFVDGTIIAGTQIGRVLAILKLEMSGALTIEEAQTNEGLDTFNVRLRDVTLDKKARVFKAALFPRCTTLAELKGHASDNQRDHVDYSSEVATFFLRFLGCGLVDTSERTTKHYLAKLEEFALTIEDEDERMDFHFKAMAELSSNSEVLNIKDWAESSLDPKTADAFLATVKNPDDSIPVVFKDLRLIRPVLDRTVFEFEGDVRVIGPNGALQQSFKQNEQGQWVLELALRHMGPTRRK